DHAYRGVKMADVPANTRYAFVTPGGPPNKEAAYPGPLAPVDDRPPVTVITHVRHLPGGRLSVRGTTTDDGEVTAVTVNGRPATALRPHFAEWAVTLTGLRPGELTVTARGEDRAGNV